MAVKHYFNGVHLVSVELPDHPLPDVLNAAPDHPFVSNLNPLGVDPALLPVDAAQLPNLKPTDGAAQTLAKFPDPLPGSGEGAGVGVPSNTGRLHDAWNNNPLKDAGTVDTVQSGPIGSRVTGVADQDRKVGGSTKSPEPGSEELPDETWTKAQLADYLGDDAPASSEPKAVFLDAAVAKAKADKPASELA